MTAIGFGSVALDGLHVSGLRFCLDDARIAATLAALGASVKLYAGKAEGRVSDLARQLVRMRRDIYLFKVEPHTLAPLVELVRALKLLNPAVDTFFWSETGSINPILAARMGTAATWIEADTPEQAAAVLAAHAGLGPCALVPLQSPYLSGLLSVHDAIRLGMTCGRDRAIEKAELAWLGMQDVPPGTVVPCDAMKASPADLLAWCTSLGAQDGDWQVALALGIDACSEALFEAMPMARIARLVVDGALEQLPAGAGAWAARIATPEDDAMRTGKAKMYGQNGNLVLHTGFYFDAKQAPGIYHLELPMELDAAARGAVYEWAAPSMDLRSAAVLHGEPESILGSIADFRLPLSRETGGWPKHTYTLSHARTGTAQVSFDGMPSAQTLRYISMSELAASNTAEDETRMVRIRSEADADALEERLQQFHLRGTMTAEQAGIPLFFENACRWMGYGGCRLPLLRRLQVGPDLGLSACRDAGEIGRLGDGYDQIVSRVKQQQQIEEVRRECAQCPARDNCSHCSQLPSEWGGRYCGMRRRYPATSLYFELFGVVQSVSRHLPAQPSIELSVSFTGLPAQHYKGPSGAVPQGRRPILLGSGGQCFAWWRGTRKLVKLSTALAMMAEAWWEGASEQDTLQALRQAFQVDDATAESSLAQGWARLRQQEIIHA